MAQMLGMDPDAVETLGKQMQTSAEEIKTTMQKIEGLLQSTQWEGADAQRFKGDEWNQHKTALTAAATALETAGQNALKNAQEQRATSQ